MSASLRVLALVVVWLLLVRGGVFGASPSPGPSPGLSLQQVEADVSQYIQFLRSLTKAAAPAGPFKLEPKVKILVDSRQFAVSDADSEHIKKHREDLSTARYFSLLPPERREMVLACFDQMVRMQGAPAGVTDATVLAFEGERQIARQVLALADGLAEIRQALEVQERAVGLKTRIPDLERPPQPSAGDPQPAASAAPAAVPGARAADPPAGGGSGDVSPCAGAAEDVKALRRETQLKMGPIRELMAAGERAIVKRFFAEARDALERSAEVADDLEKKWHKVVVDMLASVSTEERFRPECTRIVSESLSQAIAMRDVLREVYPRLGRAYLALEKWEQAAEQIKKSTVIDPNSARTWDLLGQAEYKRDLYDDAIQAFYRSVVLDEYQPEVWVRLARSHAKKGEVKRSLIYLRRAISRGFTRFGEIDEDPDFASLQGDKEYEELILMAPSTPY